MQDRSENNNRNRFYIFFSRQPLMVSAVITGILFILFFSLFNACYESNDDPTSMMISSGLLTGTPGEYLIHSNIIIGKFLQFLYTFSPAINWYPLFLYSLHFLGMTFLLYSLLYEKPGRLKIIFSSLIFLFINFFFLIALQYTTAAAVSGISGIFLLMAVFKKGGKLKIFPIITGIFLLLLCGLVRGEVFYLVILLSLPLIICFFLHNKSGKFLITIFSVIILFGMASLYNRFYYNGNPEWKEYYYYDRAREELHDTSRLTSAFNSNIEKTCKEVGWKSIDYYMFCNWMFFDRNIYSREKLEKLVKLLPLNAGKNFSLSGPAYVIINTFFLHCLALILLIFFLTPRKFPKKYIISSALLIIFMSVYMQLFMKFVFRVYLPMILLLTWTVLFFSAENLCPSLYPSEKEGSDKEKKLPFTLYSPLRKTVIIILCFFLAGSVFLSFRQLLLISSKSKIKSSEYARITEELSHKEKIYVVWGNALNMEDMGPLSAPEKLKNFNIITSGWLTHSPYYYFLLKKFEITDIYRALYEKDNVFLICRNDQEMLKLLQFYIKEHYNQDVLFRPILLWDENSRCAVKVYKTP